MSEEKKMSKSEKERERKLELSTRLHLKKGNKTIKQSFHYQNSFQNKEKP